MSQNFVETMIFERIGLYLRSTLVEIYQYEEQQFNEKLNNLALVYSKNIDKFNSIFNYELKKEHIPNKSLRIFKVFFRCQLPFEMFFTLH
mmetsp:Transcript_43840/g.31942  ORF Transcript_43840/g.31942 Transcript_43840/m.31942 type:complete len:90 (+) Transcript_43840:29-298(+)